MRKDWEYKKLGEVCDILDSQRKPVTKKDRKKGIYPYYGATGIQDFVDNYIFDGRYVLVGEDGAKWSANEKCAYIIEGKTWINNHAHVLSTKNMVIDSFLTYYLNFSDLDSYISGAIIRKLTQSSLKSIPIPLPPKPTQLAIVAELDKINELIQLKKQQLKDYDQLAQSIFYEMFGDPVENEKGWEVKKLGEISTIERGSGISKKDFCSAGLPCIHYGQIHTSFGAYTKEVLSFIPENLLPKYKYASRGDLVMAITSEDVEGSCKSTTWLGNYDVVIGSDAAICHHSQDGIYLSYYTRTKAFYNEKAKYAKGFKVTHISTKEIASIPIPLPPLPLQQQFAARIEAIEQQKQQVKDAIKDLETLLASRMQYWFDFTPD